MSNNFVFFIFYSLFSSVLFFLNFTITIYNILGCVEGSSMHDNPGDGSPSEEDPGWPAVPGAAWWDQGSPAIPWRAEE